MPFISREVQTSSRLWDAFSPLKRIAPTQDGIHSLRAIASLSDALLDGITLQRRDVAAHWIEENYVHRAVALSRNIANTKYFLGAQVVVTRDDIRQLSHFAVVEPDETFLVTAELGAIKTKTSIHMGEVRRIHICLDNFTGIVHAVLAGKMEADKYSLFLNSQPIATTSANVDFPFMAFAQPAKGRVATSPSPYALLSYKCRDTGAIFLRHIVDPNVQTRPSDEFRVAAPECLGGLDFAIHGDTVFFHVDALVDGKIVTMKALSSDRGQTISAFEPVDLAGFKPDTILPTASPVTRDYQGNFHLPVATLKDGKQHLLDVHDDHVVEAMVLDGRGYGYALLVFPKKSIGADFRGIGDGVTDGVGIIATTILNGKLMISNSQSGGFLYPKERCVNHEMAQMFAFRSTECCYTRAQSANMVSMDYVFVESNGDGDPLSSTLWLETWDMPLPIPQLGAVAEGNVVTATIAKDGWFETGKTTFVIDDPKVLILDVTFIDDRNARIICSTDALKGKKLSFDMKNFFYWHASSTTIV